MSEVTIRELRNHGAAVVDRVLAGESIVVTRSGRPVAELRPLRRRGLRAEELVERRRKLPRVDPEHLTRDVDALLESSL